MRPGRPPSCAQSYYPKFTALRIELRLSRAGIAELCASAGYWFQEDVVLRIEARGQQPSERLKEALAAVLGRPRAEIDALFEEVDR